MKSTVAVQSLKARRRQKKKNSRQQKQPRQIFKSYEISQPIGNLATPTKMSVTFDFLSNFCVFPTFSSCYSVMSCTFW